MARMVGPKRPGPAPKKRGGQPLPPSERRSVMLTIRVREADHDALRAWAGDRSLGALLIELGLRAGKAEAKAPPAAFRDALLGLARSSRAARAA